MLDRKQIEKSAWKLALQLGSALGESRVIDDRDILEQYATDKSHCAGAMPQLAVRVKDEKEVAIILEAASRHGVPVVPRGAGTGKSGGAIPVYGGMILDITHMKQIVEIDKENLLAVVQPGVITGEFQSAIEEEGLFYPPDPNSLESCTLGGNLAHNAGGPRAFKYGVTREYVLGLRAALMSGEVIAPGKRTVKGVTGYDMTSLMVGSEGTLGVFTEITVKLIRNPSVVSTMLIPMPNEESAGRAIAKIVAAGLVPRVLEFMDSVVVGVLRKKGIAGVTSNTGSLILAEVDGDSEPSVEREVLLLAEQCEKAGATDVFMAKHGGDREKLWAARRLMSDALAETARYKVSEDIVVPRSFAPKLLLGLKEISQKYNILVPSYGHAGDGNYHVNILWDENGFDPLPVIREVFTLTLALGGTITGEHGIGLSKQPYLSMEQSHPLIASQKAVKHALDPLGLLNPGKIFQ